MVENKCVSKWRVLWSFLTDLTLSVTNKYSGKFPYRNNKSSQCRPYALCNYLLQKNFLSAKRLVILISLTNNAILAYWTEESLTTNTVNYWKKLPWLHTHNFEKHRMLIISDLFRRLTKSFQKFTNLMTCLYFSFIRNPFRQVELEKKYGIFPKWRILMKLK